VEWIISNPDFDYSTIEVAPSEETLQGTEETSSEKTTEGNQQQEKKNDGKHRHNAKCDRCWKQIIGTRFKCHMCEDFDLCENCEPNALMFHDPEHIFLPHKTEYVKPVEEKKEEKMDTTPDAQEKQDPNQPLTEEEKKEEIKKKLMKKLEKEREEEEFKKQKDELRRRKENKEAREAKEKWETEKARIQREKERKEKEERERHKREVLERMEEEKKVRLAQATVPTTDVIAPKKRNKITTLAPSKSSYPTVKP